MIDVLAAAGFRSSTVRVDRGEPLPDAGSVTLAVTLGCDGAAAERAAGWIETELEWLRQADSAGTAVLGVGFGAQALALALGGGVRRAPRGRHGWVWISSSIPGWISSGPWLAWQDDVIRLPPGARLLAHDPLGPQAYSVSGHLGIQFHPEVTPKILSDWITAGHASCLDTQGCARGDLARVRHRIRGGPPAAVHLHQLAGDTPAMTITAIHVHRSTTHAPS